MDDFGKRLDRCDGKYRWAKSRCAKEKLNPADWWIYLLIAIVLTRTASGQDDTREKQNTVGIFFVGHDSKNSVHASVRNFLLFHFSLFTFH